MIKRGLCALVLAFGLLPPTVDDCKNQKKNLASHEVAIKQISTVEQAEEYLTKYLKYSYDKDNYGEEDYIASFKVIHERKTDDCDGGALAAAALLSDDGYKPLMLIMGTRNENKSWDGHAIFVYEKNGLIGCLGISKGDCIHPRFQSLEEVTMYFKFNEYKLVNLDDIAPDWKDCDYNLSNLIRFTGEFKKVQ